MSIDLLQTRIQALKTPLMLDLAPTPDTLPPRLLAAAPSAWGFWMGCGTASRRFGFPPPAWQLSAPMAQR